MTEVTLMHLALTLTPDPARENARLSVRHRARRVARASVMSHLYKWDAQ